MRTSLWLFLPLLATGCFESDSSGPGSLGDAWFTSSHPCEGYRTDTLWLDPDGTAWLGCGSTTDGAGLFHSVDDGESWSAPETEPADFFADFRVNTVSRSGDGLLYVGGTGSGDRVVALDTDSVPMAVSEVFTSSGQTWNSFQVGSFRRLDSGFAVAESLTGSDLAWRDGDEADFEDGYGWWGETAVQILELDDHDDALYGVGSTISQPPTVMLPDPGAEGPGLTPVELTGSYDGELWGLDVDEAGLVLGGVDQDAAVGTVWTAALGAQQASDFTEYRVDTVLGEEASWVRGVCRQGDLVIAVGEFSKLSDGFVLASSDGGVSFEDVTPEGEVPPVQRCAFDTRGVLHVAGGSGWYGLLE